MVKRSRGKMSKKTRSLGRKGKKLTITELVKKFEVGERVRIDAKSRYDGMPHPRYDGRHGKITARRGNAYVVRIRDLNATKELIIPALHLKKMEVRG